MPFPTPGHPRNTHCTLLPSVPAPRGGGEPRGYKGDFARASASDAAVVLDRRHLLTKVLEAAAAAEEERGEGFNRRSTAAIEFELRI